MTMQTPADSSLITDDALEQIVGARASDAQFEQAVQYFQQKDLDAIKRMRRPGFYATYGADLSALGVTSRDEMIGAAHEAMRRRNG